MPVCGSVFVNCGPRCLSEKVPQYQPGMSRWSLTSPELETRFQSSAGASLRIDTIRMTPTHGEDSSAQAHSARAELLTPCNTGGLSMLEFLEAAKADYAGQLCIAEIAGHLLDRTVHAIREGDRDLPGTHAACPLFESTVRCPLEPSAYLRRILKYSQCSPSTVLVGLLYLQRLRESYTVAEDTPLRLTSFNIQRLLLTAVMLASKFLDEPVVSNKQWALIGDMKAQEMNALELEMLWRLRFTLNVTREEYDECFDALIIMNTTYSHHPPFPPSTPPRDSKPGEEGDRHSRLLRSTMGCTASSDTLHMTEEKTSSPYYRSSRVSSVSSQGLLCTATTLKFGGSRSSFTVESQDECDLSSSEDLTCSGEIPC